MIKVAIIRLYYEDDLFLTAIIMISELLRKDSSCHKDIRTGDKIHVTCRRKAVLLAVILKTKCYYERVKMLGTDFDMSNFVG